VDASKYTANAYNDRQIKNVFGITGVTSINKERKVHNKTIAEKVDYTQIVLQRRPPKQEGTGSRIPTFVCMSKTNH